MHASALHAAVKQHNVSLHLRPYQEKLLQGWRAAWAAGAQNVMAVLPTGGGKTVTFGTEIAEEQSYSVAIAHRKELVGQMSMALARLGVRHRVLAPSPVVREIVATHMRELGTSFINPQSKVAVAGVKTLLNRAKQLVPFLQQVKLWVMDEGHHILRANEWGKAVALMPNARGLAVTATPCRADGQGLGRHADGWMDALVEGPTMRQLINDGYLCDYRIVCPPSDLDLSQVATSKTTGDLSKQQMITAVKRSKVMGDVVTEYNKWTPGFKGVTFAPDVETATSISNGFNGQGVRAEVVSAKTKPDIRAESIQRLTRREVLQLVNVDLFGEGFDLPTIESVHFARPTESFSLYCQQFGRVLRPVYADGYDLSTRDGRLAAIAAGPKPYAWVIDHVGNVVRHNGPPDQHCVWTLDRREKRAKGPRTGPLMRICTNPTCQAPYERFYTACPHCGFVEEAAARGGPEQVEGDLQLLDPAVLEQMRGEVARVDNPPHVPHNLAGTVAEGGLRKRHRERQQAQAALRDAIAWWAAFQRWYGHTDQYSYREFYYRFGMDLLSAQALGRPEAEALTTRIYEEIQHGTLRMGAQMAGADVGA